MKNNLADLPEDMNELLGTDYCGCGKVADLLSQSMTDAAQMLTGGECLVWNTARNQLALQLFSNMMVCIGIEDHGAIGAQIKAQETLNIVHKSTEHIMTHAEPMITGMIHAAVKFKEEETSAEGTSEGYTIN